MTILLATLAITFAAFCVWLTVRIVNRRERWAKWTAVAVVVLMAYPLSFGPLVWLDSRGLLPEWAQAAARVYTKPLEWSGERSSAIVDAYLWYTSFWRSREPRFREMQNP